MVEEEEMDGGEWTSDAIAKVKVASSILICRLSSLLSLVDPLPANLR